MTRERESEINVLHLDDDPEISTLSAKFLERESGAISVATATGASEALERLEQDDVDCIVSDYDMPEMTGLEFLETLHEEYRSVPFILFTGKGSEEIASRAISAGVTDYLQKEVGTDQYAVLANRIENAVAQYRAERRAENQERILRVIRKVNQTLVRASTRTDIEAGVCEIFTAAEPYRLAWIGTYDAERTQLVPRAAHGRYAEELASVAVSDRDDDSWYVSRAIRTNSLYVEQGGGRWPELPDVAATDAGFRAVAAIPLAYEDELYGVLVVYATRAGAFDRAERDMLAELGDDIAHAIHAAEARVELERHETAVEASPAGVFVVDEEATVLLVNSSAAELGGYSPDDLIGEQFLRFVEKGVFSEDIVEWYLESLRELLSSKTDREKARIQTEIHPVDAEPRTVEIHLTLRPYEEEFRGTVGILRDVTASNRREEALKRSERQFEAVFDDPDAFIWLLDPDGTLIRANETALTFVEAESTEVEGERFRETPWWSHSTELQGGLNEWVQQARAGEYVPYEATHRGPDGEEITVEGTIRPVVDDRGDVVSLLAEARDVTARKMRERELEEQRTRYRRSLETAPVPIVIVDDDYRIAFANDAAVQLVDVERPEDLTGTRALEFVPGDSRTGAQECLREVLEERTTITEVEQKVVGFDEEIRHIVLAGVPISWRGAPAAQLVLNDLTDRLAHERELARKNEQLEAFARIVSHDIRNPLNVAQLRIEMAREEFDDDHLRIADSALDRIDAIIGEMLALARGGQTITEPEGVRLAAVAEECWDTVDTDSGSLHVEDDVVIKADAARLKHVFENVYRNAVEHGGSEVSVRVGPHGSGFYVEDDGPGIAADERERVFEPGFTTADDGVGFGLSIVKNIAEAHGWEITITEGETGGARFEFTEVDP